jgi:hypothetical protein
VIHSSDYDDGMIPLIMTENENLATFDLMLYAFQRNFVYLLLVPPQTHLLPHFNCLELVGGFSGGLH